MFEPQTRHRPDQKLVQDLQRFPAPVLKVSFEGPDIPEEELWDLFRVRHCFSC
jgi:hypothetical protein